MPSIACIREVFPLPTDPQTPSKDPLSRDNVMSCRIVMVLAPLYSVDSISGLESPRCKTPKHL